MFIIGSVSIKVSCIILWIKLLIIEVVKGWKGDFGVEE